MAYLDATEITFRSAVLWVRDLQYAANTYDSFTYRVYYQGQLILTDVNTSSSSSKSFGANFSNPSYLGYNWFSPSMQYTFTVTCKYGGQDYLVPGGSFTTASISPPTGTVTPALYPRMRSQASSNSCVACTLATGLDIARYRRTGYEAENYSAAYIYGRSGNPSGMSFRDAVIRCAAGGSPRWDLITESLKDDGEKVYSTAYTLFSNSSDEANANAKNQKPLDYYNVDLYEPNKIKNALLTYGCVCISFRVPENFFQTPPSGIIPQPSGGYSGYNHTLVVIGLIQHENKPYWIVQNSWDTTWGIGGRGYLPWDWGVGVAPPIISENTHPTSWTSDSYALDEIGYISIPAAPTNVTASSVAGQDKTVKITWSSTLTGAAFIVFANQAGSPSQQGRWYIKGVTENKTLTFTVDAYATYNIRVIAMTSYATGYCSDYSNTASVVVQDLTPIPLWNWNAAQGNATAAQVQNAYKAITRVSGYVVSDFHCKVYTAFVTRINALLRKAGKSWNSYYASYVDTVMFGSTVAGRDRKLRAKMFNSIVINLGQLTTSTLPYVSGGGVVSGPYFLTLSDEINAVISQA